MEEMKVSASIARKVNLKNYESAEVFMSISAIEPGASEEEIEEALVTGDRVLVVLKRHLAVEVKKMRRQATQYLGDEE